MSPRALAIGLLSAASLLAVTGSAHATTFSFASDDDSNFLTFLGTSGSSGSFTMRNGRSPMPTPVTLVIDDDNGPLPSVMLPVGLIVNFTLTHSASIPAGGQEAHIYDVTGSYQYVNPGTGAVLLDVQVGGGGARLAVTGTSSSWGGAASLFSTGSPIANPTNVQFNTADLVGYAQSLGVTLPLEAFPFTWFDEDFSFTLSSLSADGGVVPIDVQTKLPAMSWGSESSHSAHAIAVPTPAAAGIGIFGLALGMRRRSRR